MRSLWPLLLLPLLASGACGSESKRAAGRPTDDLKGATAALANPPTPGAPAAAPKAAPVPAAPPVCSADCAATLSNPSPVPLRTGPGERRLGAEMKLPGEPVTVAEVLRAPEPYLGKTVKCAGKVARVCQAAGCWLELQADSGGEGLRVPMAGHAFFVPQDAVGHLAIVEGELRRHELPAAQRKHYEGEGMQAVGPLSLDATSVVLR